MKTQWILRVDESSNTKSCRIRVALERPGDGRSSVMCDETWMMVAEAYERGVQGSPKRCGIIEGAWDV